MSRLFAIATTPLKRWVKPIRAPRYLAYLRTLQCIACGATRRIEAAHFGPHGISQKASDADALPLCECCHRTGANAYHKLGPVDFALVHNLDVPELQIFFRRLYFNKTGILLLPVGQDGTPEDSQGTAERKDAA